MEEEVEEGGGRWEGRRGGAWRKKEEVEKKKEMIEPHIKPVEFCFKLTRIFIQTNLSKVNSFDH